MTTEKKFIMIISVVLFCISFLVVKELIERQAEIDEISKDYSIHFNVENQSGDLYLSKMPPKSWSTGVDLREYESVSSAISALYDKSKDKLWSEATLNGNRILNLGSYFRYGDHALGGDAEGLLPAPKSLSVFYNVESDELHLFWDNHKTDFDTLMIRKHKKLATRKSPDVSSCKFVRMSKSSSYTNPLNRLHVAVMGEKDDMPSNASVMLLKNNIQYELNVLPFTNGIAPNWAVWGQPSQGVTLAERIKDKDTGERYQSISIDAKDKVQVRAGLWRQFIGVTPGKRYRLAIDTKLNKKELLGTLSAHVFYKPVKKGLTAETLDAVADNTAEAAPSFDFDQPVSEEWSKHQSLDIAIPADCDSLLLFVCIKGNVSGKAGLAFDNLSLETVEP